MARPITLAIAGDVMLGRLVNEAIARHGFAHPWGNTRPLLQQADLFLINLECALTARAERWRDGAYKAFYFRAEPEAVETLKLGRVDFASLANNHIADFGMEGLLETVRVLDAAGIAHAGAGPDLDSARRPAYLTAGETRVAVLAFADHPEEWAATPASAGMSYLPVSVEPHAFAVVEEALTAAREQADLVVFSIHWGPNMRSRPTPGFRAFARRVIEAGADIFWGHSAHVVQGIELYQRKPILYDTGDFIDDYAVDPALRNDLSALFLLDVRPPEIERVELVPVQISRMRVNTAAGVERAWFRDRVATLCAELGTRVSDQGDRFMTPSP